MQVTLEQGEVSNVIHLEGAIDISCAVELKTVLTMALELGKKVCISLQNVTGLDVTAVQLLWAAERAARRAGMRIELESPLPQAVISQLASVGFSGFPLS